MVEFRVLGPLDIVRDRRAVPLPAPAEQVLLAVLLLNPCRTVAADILIDALWEIGLPARPANALQHRVSKLRRALTEAGLSDGLLVHRLPGYRLDVDPGDIDAHRFTTAVGQARRLADVGAPNAARCYEEALALWRGPALAGIDNAWIRREASRLDELQLVTTEEWVALALAGGRHADLVGKLESLVAVHPLRERLHEQLILALYRSGRQADALAAYRRARARLAEELGIDPSPALRELEQAILCQDPHLDSPGASRYAPPPLPARTASMVGRSAERDRTTDLLGRHRLVTLTGPGGVGKTTVALDVATRLAADFPDGVWLARLAGLTEPARLARAVADVLGCAEDDMADEALVRLLQERATLLVLDNCEHLVDECAALVSRLLAACPSLRVLSTSREALAITGEAQLPIPPLASPPAGTAVAALLHYDAVALFVDRARAARPDFDLDSGSASHVAGISARSTAYRSPLSWPPPWSGRCRWTRSSAASTTGSACSPGVSASPRPGTERSKRPSIGATNCSPAPSEHYFAGWRCSAEAGPSPPPSRCVPDVASRRTRSLGAVQLNSSTAAWPSRLMVRQSIQPRTAMKPSWPVPSSANSMKPGSMRSMASRSHASISTIRHRPVKDVTGPPTLLSPSRGVRVGTTGLPLSASSTVADAGACGCQRSADLVTCDRPSQRQSMLGTGTRSRSGPLGRAARRRSSATSARWANEQVRCELRWTRRGGRQR